MRSSQKSNRNRGNKNRNKSLGNVQNRVFESAGPEGKVRGTPQQIIDKYEQLARDAQTSGDRVMAENFLQHAEHYARLLSQAQAEMAAHQAAQQQRQQDQGRPHGHDGGPQGGKGRPEPGGPQGAPHGGPHGAQGGGQPANGQARAEDPAPSGGGLETIDPVDDGPSLIATPEAPQPSAGGQPEGEAAAKPRSRRRRGPRKDRAEEGAAAAPGGDGEGAANGTASAASESGEAPKPVAETPAEGG
ncbi:MAG: DUF4167 domain-containing protein [Pseudomonadota bacterium]